LEHLANKLQPLEWDPLAVLPSEVCAALSLGRHDPPIVLQINRQVLRDHDYQRLLNEYLTAEEKRHQLSFYRQEDRQRYLLGRAGLRILLARLLDLDPQELLIQCTSHGKPVLAVDSIQFPPEFNISHAGDLILLAIHPSLAVGVDVERLDRNFRWDRLAHRFLSTAEISVLQELQPQQSSALMLLHWCRIEAELKCLGHGLAGLEALEARRLCQLTPDAVLQQWDLTIGAGYCGALACSDLC
jgi:4'-phosphopantetheinyl transferase